MKVRRVVTGHDAAGKAVFASDEEVDGIRPMLNPLGEFHRLWGGDDRSQFPDDGSVPQHHSYFPPLDGFRFGLFALPPASKQGLPDGVDIAEGLAEFEEVLPGIAAHMEPADPGMHTTATIDFEVVLEGDVWLELDDGAEVHLFPGDTVVQNGTRHRWHNRSETQARLAVFMVGAKHANVHPA